MIVQSGYATPNRGHVPKASSNSHLYELAKRGAEVQLRELLHEAKLILALFPHLRDCADQDELFWQPDWQLTGSLPTSGNTS